MFVTILSSVLSVFSVDNLGHFEKENDSLTVKNPVIITHAPKEYTFPEIDEKFPVNKILNSSDASSGFNYEKLAAEYPVPAKVLDAREHAKAGFAEIDEKNRWVESLAESDIHTLPVGTKGTFGSVEYAIGYIRAKVTKDYAELTAFIRIKLPQTDNEGKPIEIFFGADNVKVTHNGGIHEDVNLALLGDVFIPNSGKWITLLKGSVDYRSQNTDPAMNNVGRTYAKLTCEGLKDMQLVGEVQFPRNVVVPVGPNGEQLPGKISYVHPDKSVTQVENRVSGTFTATTMDWNDIMIETTFPHFALTGYQDMLIFSVKQATFDSSDHKSPEDFSLDWRGVFIGSAEVGLPKQFRTNRNSEKRIFIGATRLILDNKGFSGKIHARNVFPVSEGITSRKNGWQYGLDYYEISFEADRLISGQLGGKLVLPISGGPTENEKKQNNKENNSSILFTGFIDRTKIQLTANLGSEINFDAFVGKATLSPNSGIEMTFNRDDEEGFDMRATLNGSLNVNGTLLNKGETAAPKNNNASGSQSSLDDKVQFNGLKFQNLVIQTQKPVLTVDYFGYEKDLSLCNFPVSIKEISVSVQEERVALGFGLVLNLMEGDFGAETKIEIASLAKHKNGALKFEPLGITMGEISLKADLGAIKMAGGLKLLRNDPEYGNGFTGFLDVEIAALKGTTIRANAIFGKKDFRYWYFDVLADNLPTANSPTGITLKGIGGGAFYHMKRRGFNSAFSPSGLSYEPTTDIHLGLKMMVLFGIINPDALNGGAGFEIAFNKNFGVMKMGFYGEAHVMQGFDVNISPKDEILNTMKDPKSNDDSNNSDLGIPLVDKSKEAYPSKVAGESGINAYLGIEYDFQSKELHGELDIYIDVAAGILQGRSSNGRAGWAVLHLSENEKYLHIGTPDDRIGLRLGVGGLSLEINGYFMLGDNLPEMPLPSANLLNVMDVEPHELDMRDEGALSTGSGFAFGHDLHLDTGDINFLILYARFIAGGGMDVMLKDYGETFCSNTESQLGIDGWYASGQLYAYLEGELGIKIRLFGIEEKFTIIKGGVGAILQVKAPNPTFLHGQVAGTYNLLGGLVEGNYSCEVTLGDECIILDESPLGGLKMISDLTPADGKTGVDVFAMPQATFAMSVDKPFEFMSEGVKKTFKIKLEKFEVLEDKKKIAGELEWGSDKNKGTFVSTDILPPNKKMEVRVEVSFLELVNGRYETVQVNGKKATEKKIHEFTTGEAPDYIPLHNITYTYPVPGQRDFFRDEYQTGYTQLRRGQDYLFEDKNWATFVKFIEDNGESGKVPVGYDTSANKVHYQLPRLDRSKGYTLYVFSIPKNAATNTSESDKKHSKTTNYDDDNSMVVTSTRAENVSKEDGEIERISYDFSTSEYDKFKNKINDLRTTHYLWRKPESEVENTSDVQVMGYSDVILLTTAIKEHIGFDKVELAGNGFSEDKPLVQVEAKLNDKYFTKDMNPVLYSRYLNTPYSIDRDPNIYGSIPKKAVNVITSYLSSLDTGENVPWRKTYFPYRYDLAHVYSEDFMDVRLKVLNARYKKEISSDSDLLYIIDKMYQFMRYGDYDIKLQYVLPGNIKSSEASYNFMNPITLRR